MLEKLPTREEAVTWAKNLESWGSYLSTPIEQLDEAMTVEKLSEKVAECNTVEKIAEQLVETVDTIDWMNRLHQLIFDSDERDLFDQLRLIPNQAGQLKKLTELRRDPGIDGELKDIAEQLGLPVREDLLDHGLKLEQFQELQPKPEEEVLTASLQKLKERSRDIDNTFRELSVQFFEWLVSRNKLDYLDGFPVILRAASLDNAALLTLFNDRERMDEIPLAPVDCWPEAAREVADLFQKHTLADDYREALIDETLWMKVTEAGYVRLNPIYTTRRRVPFLPDEPLPASDNESKQKHRTEKPVEISALAFFEKEETGLDTVRRSKKRAVSLLLFLMNHVLVEDTDSLETKEATCEHCQRKIEMTWDLSTEENSGEIIYLLKQANGYMLPFVTI